MFDPENARMLSVIDRNPLFAMWMYVSRILPQWWVVFRVATGKLTLLGSVQKGPVKDLRMVLFSFT